MEVVLKNVRHGVGERKSIIYAEIWYNGGMIVGASLEYCLALAKECGYTFVKVKED